MGLDICSLYVLIQNDRSTRELAHADPKQMEKMAAQAEHRTQLPSELTSDAAPPKEYRESRLSDPRSRLDGARVSHLRLSQIRRHVLRASCRRCERVIEIQTADAVRMYGGDAAWKDVAQRLLDDTCQERTGRHEEDGCWPGFDTS